MTGTRTLTRLALRLDRVRLSVWVLAIGLTPALTAANYKQLYPDEQSLKAVSGVVSNASLEAINGPLFGVSLGGLTAWKIGATAFILVAVMSILTVVRHTRAEEESGRLELVGAGVVGRYAPLTAALVTAGLANVGVVVLTALGLIGVGLPAGGSVAFALAIGGTGLLFAAVAVAAAQITESARTAGGIAFAVLGAAYLLRALGDTGPIALTWISPIGWGMRVRSYAAEQWWVFGLFVALGAVLLVTAYALVARRDMGGGLVAARPARAAAVPSLRSSLALAWRLHRGLLLGWTVGMVAAGLVLGGAAHGIAGVAPSQRLSDMLARLGGTKAVVNAYLGAVFGITGLTVAAYTVQATLRMRAEEASGRLEPLLATQVGRVRWALSHLIFALLGTAVLLAVAGIGGGLAYGGQIHDVGGQVASLLGAAMVQLPAAWVLAGLGMALFGLVPRLSSLAWAALVVCVLVLELGAILGINQTIIDVSPFAHVPKLPGQPFTSMPLVWLTLVAAALGIVGLVGFRRRDIGAG